MYFLCFYSNFLVLGSELKKADPILCINISDFVKINLVARGSLTCQDQIKFLISEFLISTSA